jgi:hypothetical protein
MTGNESKCWGFGGNYRFSFVMFPSGDFPKAAQIQTRGAGGLGHYGEGTSFLVFFGGFFLGGFFLYLRCKVKKIVIGILCGYKWNPK